MHFAEVVNSLTKGSAVTFKVMPALPRTESYRRDEI